SFVASRGPLTSYGCYGYTPGMGDSGLGSWSAQDGQTEKHPGGRTNVHAYTADGTRFVASVLRPQPRLVVYEGQSGAEICSLADRNGLMPLRKGKISREGRRAAALPGGEALLGDGNPGKLRARRTDPSKADLSPDGRRWGVATRPVFAPPP